MKSIELTDAHKSKLLEMCEKLFPKSKIQFTDDFYCEWSLFLITEDDYDSTLPEDKVECHWFEFCMTHLVKKISILEDSKLGDDDSDSIHMNIIKLCREKYDNLCKNILDSWSNHIHPIDYLYSEFKKLK